MIRSLGVPLLAAVILCAACSTGGKHGAATPTTLAATSLNAAQRRALATQYMTIATVGNRGLDRAFDALEGPDKNHLTAARADLRRAAAIERTFDRGLETIVFPRAIEATARALVGVNEARATLTSEATASTSLRQLRGYETRLTAANATLEGQVKNLRSELGLPPPETS
jgi:hypothetical protein